MVRLSMQTSAPFPLSIAAWHSGKSVVATRLYCKSMRINTNDPTMEAAPLEVTKIGRFGLSTVPQQSRRKNRSVGRRP